MTQINNEFGITKVQYQDEFVMKLAKSGFAILESLINPIAIRELNIGEVEDVNDKLHLIHMVWGVSGETFEFQDACMEGDSENAQEELGDSLFYLVGLFPVLKLEGYWYDYLTHTGGGNVHSYCQSMGELLDQAKKYVIYDKEEKFVEVQAAWKQCMQEISEAIYYEFDPMIKNPDDALQACIDNNVTKLAKRYSGLQYSNEAAIARADKAE